jgi:hypothetical protein
VVERGPTCPSTPVPPEQGDEIGPCITVASDPASAVLAWLMTPGIGEQLPSLADLLGRPLDERSRRSGVPGGTPLAWWSDDLFGWLRNLG